MCIFEIFLLEFYIAGNLINFSNSVKYLGIYLNQSLTDDNDIMRQVKCLYTTGNKLRSDFLSVLYPLKIYCLVLTALIFMLLDCGVILNWKALEDYV